MSAKQRKERSLLKRLTMDLWKSVAAKFVQSQLPSAEDCKADRITNNSH